MVNITKPPECYFYNNYNTIVKETQEYQKLFPEVEPINFSTCKQRTSTINYDIMEVAKRAQLELKAIQYNQEDEGSQDIHDDSKEQARKFQALLEDESPNAKRSGKGVRFGISISMSDEDHAPKEFIDYHIDDNEDKKNYM
jgi:hypothetical protein